MIQLQNEVVRARGEALAAYMLATGIFTALRKSGALNDQQARTLIDSLQLKIANFKKPHSGSAYATLLLEGLMPRPKSEAEVSPPDPVKPESAEAPAEFDP